jgi:hypothetical protein
MPLWQSSAFAVDCMSSSFPPSSNWICDEFVVFEGEFLTVLTSLCRDLTVMASLLTETCFTPRSFPSAAGVSLTLPASAAVCRRINSRSDSFIFIFEAALTHAIVSWAQLYITSYLFTTYQHRSFPIVSDVRRWYAWWSLESPPSEWSYVLSSPTVKVKARTVTIAQ